MGHAAAAPHLPGQAAPADLHRPRPEHDQRSHTVPQLARRARHPPARLPPGRHRRLADGRPGAADVRDFLAWAARQGHCQLFDIPRQPRRAGTAIGDSQRWDLVTRLLHDDSIQVTDRVAGCLVLLFGQNMTRVAAMTTSQVTRRGDGIYVQFGRHEVPVPGTLGSLLLTLIADGKPNTGTGSPAVSQWLFPGLLPGQPITPARLAGRLRALGIPVKAGRRAALTGLAAQLPAAVLADTLGLQPATAVRWMHDARADWNRYAADLARTRNHQPRE